MAERVEQQETGDEVLVRVIDKGLGGRIHVRVSRFKDRDYIDVRNFYETDDGQWLPTRKGIAVPVELYGELLDALSAAKAEVDKRIAADGGKQPAAKK
jgi:hypothetical protein